MWQSVTTELCQVQATFFKIAWDKKLQKTVRPHCKASQSDVIHDFWYLGKGDEGDKKLKCYTLDLFTLKINIH